MAALNEAKAAIAQAQEASAYWAEEMVRHTDNPEAKKQYQAAHERLEAAEADAEEKAQKYEQTSHAAAQAQDKATLMADLAEQADQAVRKAEAAKADADADADAEAAKDAYVAAGGNPQVPYQAEEEQPVEEQPVEKQPVEEQPCEEPVEEQPVEQQPVEQPVKLTEAGR